MRATHIPAHGLGHSSSPPPPLRQTIFPQLCAHNVAFAPMDAPFGPAWFVFVLATDVTARIDALVNTIEGRKDIIFNDHRVKRNVVLDFTLSQSSRQMKSAHSGDIATLANFAEASHGRNARSSCRRRSPRLHPHNWIHEQNNRHHFTQSLISSKACSSTERPGCANSSWRDANANGVSQTNRRARI